MIARSSPSLVSVALGLALATGCAPKPLLARAIAARGGPLGSIVRFVEADVTASFAAGRWRWRTVFLVPDHFAWTIETTGDPLSYLFDGEVVRAFVGDVAVSAATAARDPIRSQARFWAVVNLDALALPGARVAPLSAEELPPGTTAGLAVVLGDAERYRLGFDDRLRLVWASGSIELPPLGRGTLVARYTDFRRRRARLLPFRTSYAFDGEPIAEERVLAACPNPGDVTAAAFHDPALLPRCRTRDAPD